MVNSTYLHQTCKVFNTENCKKKKIWNVWFINKTVKIQIRPVQPECVIDAENRSEAYGVLTNGQC